MQCTTLRTALGSAAASALLFSACGDGLSKGSLAKPIGEHVAKSATPVCWSLERMPARFPVRVFFREPPQQHPLLGGLVRSGLLSMQPARVTPFGGEWLLDLTEAGRKAKAWDDRDGFCVGRPKLEEVVRWTEPTSAGNTSVVVVTYHWKLDRPDWVKPEQFRGIKGLSEAVEEQVPVVKTSDGWRVGR